MVEKVIATPAALELIAHLKTIHGPDLMFHQSGGCCDNSAPNCYLNETPEEMLNTPGSNRATVQF